MKTFKIHCICGYTSETFTEAVGHYMRCKEAKEEHAKLSKQFDKLSENEQDYILQSGEENI